MGIFDIFKTSEADIINNKKIGVVYVADFPQKTGKYISIAEYGSKEIPDLDVKVSSRIHLRITYLTNSEKISGVEISKVNGNKIEKINFSTFDFERILQLLSLFSELDLKAVVNKTVIFNESIISDSEEVSRFLTLIASDPEGKKKLGEVANNYELIKVGDIDNIIQKKEAVQLFDKILNSQSEFLKYKLEIGVGKNEEVWQRFFQINNWILGAEYVEILDHRNIDEESITDYLLKSYDGFVDIIELKLHSEIFWTKDLIPDSKLTKATMQCIRYISEIEKKIDSKKFNDKLGNSSVVKPKITLIYGRSSDWESDKKESYRILNSSYHNISILTFDHVLERAKRITGIIKVKETQIDKNFSEDVNLEDIPF